MIIYFFNVFIHALSFSLASIKKVRERLSNCAGKFVFKTAEDVQRNMKISVTDKCNLTVLDEYLNLTGF